MSDPGDPGDDLCPGGSGDVPCPGDSGDVPCPGDSICIPMLRASSPSTLTTCRPSPGDHDWLHFLTASFTILLLTAPHSGWEPAWEEGGGIWSTVPMLVCGGSRRDGRAGVKERCSTSVARRCEEEGGEKETAIKTTLRSSVSIYTLLRPQDVLLVAHLRL